MITHNSANKKPRIMVVDDEVEIVSMFESYLKPKGYEVKGCLSGEEALALLDQRSTDVILLDRKMPGIQGDNFAKIIKEKYPFVKIIMVTGFADGLNNILQEGILEALFVKPVKIRELYAKIEELEIKLKDEVKNIVTYMKLKVSEIIIDEMDQNYKEN